MTASEQRGVANTTTRAVTDVCAAWRKTIDSLLETAALLYAYSQQANWREIKEQLQIDGVMSSSVISMMLGIGRDPRLQKPSIKKLLPPSYNTLYLLTRLDDDLIDAKIKREELNPSITVDEVRQWSKSSSATRASTPVIEKKIVLRLPSSFSPRDQARLLKQLQSVVDFYPGVKVSKQ